MTDSVLGIAEADDASLRRTFRLRAIIAVPLMLGLVALLIFLTVSSSAAHACRPGTAPHVASCQSGSRLQDHSPAG